MREAEEAVEERNLSTDLLAECEQSMTEEIGTLELELRKTSEVSGMVEFELCLMQKEGRRLSDNHMHSRSCLQELQQDLEGAVAQQDYWRRELQATEEAEANLKQQYSELHSKDGRKEAELESQEKELGTLRSDLYSLQMEKSDKDTANGELTLQLAALEVERGDLRDSKSELNFATATLASELQVTQSERKQFLAKSEHWHSEYGTMQAEKEGLDAAHVALEAKKCDLDAVNSEMASQLEAMRSGKDELQGMYDALEDTNRGLDAGTADLSSKLRVSLSEEERPSSDREHWRSEYGTMQAGKEELEAEHVALEAKKCDHDAVNSEMASQLEPIRSGKDELQGMYDALEEGKLGVDAETADLTSRLQSARSEEGRLSAEREHWRSEYGTMQL